MLEYIFRRTQIYTYSLGLGQSVLRFGKMVTDRQHRILVYPLSAITVCMCAMRICLPFRSHASRIIEENTRKMREERKSDSMKAQSRACMEREREILYIYIYVMRNAFFYVFVERLKFDAFLFLELVCLGKSSSSDTNIAPSAEFRLLHNTHNLPPSALQSAFLTSSEHVINGFRLRSLQQRVPNSETASVFWGAIESQSVCVLL